MTREVWLRPGLHGRTSRIAFNTIRMVSDVEVPSPQNGGLLWTGPTGPVISELY